MRKQSAGIDFESTDRVGRPKQNRRKPTLIIMECVWYHSRKRILLKKRKLRALDI